MCIATLYPLVPLVYLPQMLESDRVRDKLALAPPPPPWGALSCYGNREPRPLLSRGCATFPASSACSRQSRISSRRYPGRCGRTAGPPGTATPPTYAQKNMLKMDPFITNPRDPYSIQVIFIPKINSFACSNNPVVQMNKVRICEGSTAQCCLEPALKNTYSSTVLVKTPLIKCCFLKLCFCTYLSAMRIHRIAFMTNWSNSSWSLFSECVESLPVPSNGMLERASPRWSRWVR